MCFIDMPVPSHESERSYTMQKKKKTHVVFLFYVLQIDFLQQCYSILS